MNAVLTLTDRERAQIRKNVFNDSRADADFVHEAMGEDKKAWHAFLLSGDTIGLSRAMDKAVLDYCEALDLFGEAERELLAAIERSGGRRLA